MKHLLQSQIALAAQQHGTPCWIYDAEAIAAQANKLKGFATVRYAQKACSNITILRILKAEGVKIDAVSEGEIVRALRAGFSPADGEIVFTSDVLDRSTLDLVCEKRIELNAGSLDMLRQVGEKSPGHRVWLRINPGFGHGHSHKTNTGGENSKHGIWHSQLAEAYKLIQKYELHLVGLHVHIGSGADFNHLSSVCNVMEGLVEKLNRPLEAISAGGGLPVSYHDDEEPFDLDLYCNLWEQTRKRIETKQGAPLRLEIEPGRYLVAEAGHLVAEVRSIKHAGKNKYVLLDAGFNDLVRPAMYGCFHKMSVLSKDGLLKNKHFEPVIIAGPLCESGDVFSVNHDHHVEPRSLAKVTVGDYLVIHDAGAYGASMSSNYNSRPLIPEVLINQGELKLIRRRQTVDELINLEIFSDC